MQLCPMVTPRCHIPLFAKKVTQVGKQQSPERISFTYRKPGVNSNFFPPGWLGKTSSKK